MKLESGKLTRVMDKLKVTEFRAFALVVATTEQTTADSQISTGLCLCTIIQQ